MLWYLLTAFGDVKEEGPNTTFCLCGLTMGSHSIHAFVFLALYVIFQPQRAAMQHLMAP